jgi:hypothetical protein
MFWVKADHCGMPTAARRQVMSTGIILAHAAIWCQIK